MVSQVLILLNTSFEQTPPGKFDKKYLPGMFQNTVMLTKFAFSQLFCFVFHFLYL